MFPLVVVGRFDVDDLAVAVGKDGVGGLNIGIDRNSATFAVKTLTPDK